MGKWTFGSVAWALLVGILAAPAWADLPIEQPPINYLNATADNPVSRLQKRIDGGEVTLRHDAESGQGYLRSVLQALEVPVESQDLVFTKTSFQNARISPRTPRAIYFGDGAYVGFVRGGDVLEIAAVDPQLGAVFYLLDQQKTDKPEFQRQTHSCLLCHQSSKTQDVPGLLVRSVYPSRTGLPVYNAGSFVTDHASPLSERWGGWYVTGQHGDQRHMGNVLVEDRTRPEALDVEAGANRADLKGLVDTSPYATGHSDIVALMVLEHQTQGQNLITLANFQARMGQHYDEGINKAMSEPPGTVSESTGRRVASHAEKLVKYLLFSGETKLTSPIQGASGFAEVFAARGPRDHKGRSLRDFDLKTRLFRHPCSYLIQSPEFDGLPPLMKAEVYRRLLDVLTGRDSSSDYAHLSPDDRRAILEILRETQPGLPEEWEVAGE